MTSSRRLAALSLLVALTSGCTGEEQPEDVARTDPSPTSSDATGATEDAGPEPAVEPQGPPLVFQGSTGATVGPSCEDGSGTYLALHQRADVTSEIRLGEVAVAGQGRLVGEVFISPTSRRGPDEGALVVGDEPGHDFADLPQWRDRVELQGQGVQPGAYVVFAEIELRPGQALQGLDVSYFDSNATGSARLDVPVTTAPCRD